MFRIKILDVSYKNCRRFIQTFRIIISSDIFIRNVCHPSLHTSSTHKLLALRIHYRNAYTLASFDSVDLHFGVAAAAVEETRELLHVHRVRSPIGRGASPRPGVRERRTREKHAHYVSEPITLASPSR